MTIRIAGGEHRGRVLKAVPGDRTRPTTSLVREAAFSIAGPLAGKRVLDLFAGTGTIGLEALSRGASDVVAVERSREACRVIGDNARSLCLEGRIRIFAGEAERILDRLGREGEPPFDLVYADPPYAFDRWEELLAKLPPLLSAGAVVVIEHGAGVDPAAPPDFGLARRYRYGESALSVFRLGSAGVCEA